MIETHKGDKSWLAIYTRSRTEKKVAEELVSKGIETYLPLEKKLKQWSDRKKWVYEPLFRSYVFIKVPLNNYQPALNTPGVVALVKFEEKPAVIPDSQIKAVKEILESEESYEVTSDAFDVGEHIKIEQGSLKGLEGELIQHMNRYKVLIRITTINQNLLVKINPSYIRRM